ncbi:hypothetical protein [Echinimonas agarilytica]|uniref:Uncharacterized protein n=1 Tax=Echinimonas agarilytica TaxID=1215918 RepID=A0AA41WAY4_9GAMM|nr:hypothetical protein [Echinimonas agarilytica]MCM2681168.1 hypothetical protein [Echinimonas agarilytica]
MKVVNDETGAAVGLVVNVSTDQARGLYLWHNGKIRPRSKSFELPDRGTIARRHLISRLYS